MSSVVIAGDTSGAITLQAPAVAGTTTLTLPAVSGTVMAPATAGTSGQLLTSAGTGAAPTWSTPVTPGATTQYSLIQGSSANPLLIKPADLATGGFTTGKFVDVATNYIANTSIPVWSSYYSLWFTLTSTENTGSTISLLSSADGVTWRYVFFNVYSLTAAPQAAAFSVTNNNFGGARVAVDETNGRVFLVYRNSSNYPTVLYSNPTSDCVITGWTNLVLLSSAISSNITISYVKMATTGASGMVVYFTTTTGPDYYVYTCSAGSTTFTQRYTAGASANDVGTIKYEDSGKIGIYLNATDKLIYTTSGNITTGWNKTNGMGGTAPSDRLGDVGGGYFVSLYDSREIMYATNPALTFTRVVLSTGDNQISYVVFMGTYWAAFCNTGTVYTTATTNPALTWTPTTNAQLNRAVYLTGYYGKRVY